MALKSLASLREKGGERARFTELFESLKKKRRDGTIGRRKESEKARLTIP